MKYKKLFEYLESKIEFDPKTISIKNCDNKFTLTKEFCEANNLYKQSVIDRCFSTGACCDCEILMNSKIKIDENEDMPKVE
jgi:hypothetical protein